MIPVKIAPTKVPKTFGLPEASTEYPTKLAITDSIRNGSPPRNSPVPNLAVKMIRLPPPTNRRLHMQACGIYPHEYQIRKPLHGFSNNVQISPPTSVVHKEVHDNNNNHHDQYRHWNRSKKALSKKFELRCDQTWSHFTIPHHHNRGQPHHLHK